MFRLFVRKYLTVKFDVKEEKAVEIQEEVSVSVDGLIVLNLC